TWPGSGFLPDLLFGLSMLVAGAATLTGTIWFAWLAFRRKHEKAAPLPSHVPARAARRRKRRRWTRIAIAAAALMAALALCEVMDLTHLTEIFRPDGTLVVHVEDPGLSVRIDGEKVSTAGPGSYSFRLPSGTHRVDVFQGDKLIETSIIDIPI